MTHYYQTFINRNTRRYDLLDKEFSQIQQAYIWLCSQNGAQLLQFINDLALYLQARSLHRVLLNYCQDGLRAAESLNANPGWLLIFIYEAYMALGEWEKARISVQQAIGLTENNDSKTYAQAVLALGRLQINIGEYRSALRTLETAEKLSRTVSDLEGVAIAKAEVAAYFLYIGEYLQALNLHLEVDGIRQDLEPSASSDRSLLLLGVTYRRLKDYSAAIKYLKELLHNAESRNNQNTMATAMHHLAWVYYDQRKLAEAKQLGTQAKILYNEIEDPRGSSDAGEQLGLIALHEQDFETASLCLERSLLTRRRLGNRQGTASSLRGLAQLHLQQSNIWLGLRYLVQSLVLYFRLGVLSRHRIFKVLGDMIRS